LLVATYWRTNLTMRQLGPLFGVSKSAAGRIIDHLGPMFALQPRKRFAKDTVLIVDGTLVPTRDHTVAERSKNYRYSTNHQVVIDADTRLIVVVGQPLAGNRNDCKASEESGAKTAVTGLVIPHRRERGQTELPGLEGGAQPLPQAGPSPCRARLRPHEDLEDPPRLPTQRAPQSVNVSGQFLADVGEIREDLHGEPGAVGVPDQLAQAWVEGGLATDKLHVLGAHGHKFADHPLPVGQGHGAVRSLGRRVRVTVVAELVTESGDF
jgi:hypothetical protein